MLWIFFLFQSLQTNRTNSTKQSCVLLTMELIRVSISTFFVIVRKRNSISKIIVGYMYRLIVVYIEYKCTWTVRTHIVPHIGIHHELENLHSRVLWRANKFPRLSHDWCFPNAPPSSMFPASKLHQPPSSHQCAVDPYFHSPSPLHTLCKSKCNFWFCQNFENTSDFVSSNNVRYHSAVEQFDLIIPRRIRSSNVNIKYQTEIE